MKTNTNKPLPLRWKPTQIQGKRVDVFTYPISSVDGLSPSARTVAIAEVAKQLQKRRYAPCLHVEVAGKGDWYINELRHLVFDIKLPIAITPPNYELQYRDFCGVTLPLRVPRKPTPPDFDTFVFSESSLNSEKLSSELKILRALARTTLADTKEIASLAGFGRTYTGKLLHGLTQNGYVHQHKDGYDGKRPNHPIWEISQSGVQYVHSSWNIPAGCKFKSARAEQKTAGRKHQKMSRLFPAWLKKTYEHAPFDLWCAWTEPKFGLAHPDALVWGSYAWEETLFWLEVETGKKSEKKIIQDITSRYNHAATLAKVCNVQIVFVVLSLPWVLKTLANKAPFTPNEKVAIVLENWRNEGYLGHPIFGGINSFLKRPDFPLVRVVHNEYDPRIGFPAPKKFDPKKIKKYRKKK